MVLDNTELQKLDGRTIAMVDGGFDPLHHGHLKYFFEAKKLGYKVLCNMRGDSYLTEGKKRYPVLEERYRAELIDALKPIDYVFICNTSTADVLNLLKPKFYCKGADWKARGLPSVELELCKKHNIEVVYLDTMLDSSTRIFGELKKSIINDYLNEKGG